MTENNLDLNVLDPNATDSFRWARLSRQIMERAEFELARRKRSIMLAAFDVWSRSLLPLAAAAALLLLGGLSLSSPSNDWSTTTLTATNTATTPGMGQTIVADPNGLISNVTLSSSDNY